MKYDSQKEQKEDVALKKIIFIGYLYLIVGFSIAIWALASKGNY